MLKNFSFALTVLILATLGIYPQSDQLPLLYDREIVSKPDVATPLYARQTGLSGTVKVSVAVDANGNVLSVLNSFGPGAVCEQVKSPDVLALRQTASEAARLVKFAPTKAGEPTIAESWIEFEFARLGNEDEKPVDASEPPGTVSPSTAKAPPGNKKYTVKGDINYSVAEVERGKFGDPSPPANQSGGKGEKYTMVPDQRYTAVSAAAPGYSVRGKRVSAGVLNGKALSLPKPAFPRAARAVHATGAVSVSVLIDTDGKVFSAYAVSGHPLLRANSIIAACKSEFAPVLLSGGQPVKVVGVITYNYVP